MQPHNVNVLTKSLKFKRFDVKLQNSQNSSKFLMFFVKSQRREHCDSEIIHVTFNWIIKSINLNDFLAKVMRRSYVCDVCVYVQCLIWSIKNTFQKPNAFFKEWKHWLKSCLWATFEMLETAHKQIYSLNMFRTIFELNINISARDFSNRPKFDWKIFSNSRCKGIDINKKSNWKKLIKKD